jgi:D-alanine-D-alanine ligase-like ATP-grasp enzyme
LASTAFTNEKVLYTTRVDQNRLDFANPWFIQEWVEAEYDVTVLIVGNDIYPFQRKRTSGQTVDWRKEQNYSSKVREWLPAQLSQLEIKQLRAFVASESLNWGRIDLLRSYEGELVFLELNANGQFGFLDPLNELGLLSNVAKHLSKHPESKL